MTDWSYSFIIEGSGTFSSAAGEIDGEGGPVISGSGDFSASAGVMSSPAEGAEPPPPPSDPGGGGGFGSIWGGSWGGATTTVEYPDASIFDLFCFNDLSMFQVLLDPNVSTVGNGAQFFPNPATLDLEITSGGALTDDAQLIITTGIPPVFTVEWSVKFTDLPNDFTNLSQKHIYLAVTDAAGPLVGFFFSKIGMAYTGSVSFPGGNLALDTTFQVLPGSSDYVPWEDEYIVIRAAADYNLNLLYVYVTRLSDVGMMGQQLRAILPIIPYNVAANPVTDRAIISVRGTLTSPTTVLLDAFCVGSALVIPNLAPVADAGVDQAARACSIVQLNGAQSFDPEGASIIYQWRLTDGPNSSEFVIEEHDGFTIPVAVPDGFTTKFYSVELGVVDALDAITVGTGGDVLLLRGEAYTLVSKGIDGSGFYVAIGDNILPDNITSETFKVLRQRGISGPTAVTPTFYPDKPGFYRFDLTVFDGSLYSDSSVVLVNVLESALPRGCVPDLSFIFTYLSDFWNLVEDRERIPTFWSAMAQAAATELYSLWQIEYSKSLRDVQRTFVRRWLHYDPVLTEPLAELTKVRALYGGVSSLFIASGGAGGIHGSTIIFSSPLLSEDIEVVVKPLDPVTADALAADIQYQLRERGDERFTAFVVLDRTDASESVRIDAPFPFSVTFSDTSLFTVGQDDRAPSGNGNAVGARLYKVDRSLEGLDIKEDDFLVLAGVAYRVARIIDDPNDDYPFQRIITKEDLPIVVSTTWELSGWVTSELLDFYAGLVTREDHIDFEVSTASDEFAPIAAVHETVETRVLGASSVLTSRLAVDMWPVSSAIADPALRVLLMKIVRRTYVPVNDLVVDIPVLSEIIVVEDDTATLRRNLDFFIETHRGQSCIRFVSGLNGGPDVWEAVRPPERLWAEYSYIDNRPTIEANFGIPVGLTIDELEDLPDTVDYLSAVRGLWYAFYNGPTVRNLRAGTQILLGLPFVEEPGIIEEIRTDISPTEGRILIRDSARPEIVRAYKFPSVLPLEVNPATGELYKVGDTVSQFAPLVEGAEVVDYLKDPKWFEGLLNQGVFFEVEKFHKFVVRVDEAAFSLNTLLFVKKFILKIKPTYTLPLFIVRKRVKETEVNTTDNIRFGARIMFFDSPCEALFGATFMYDEPRSGGGGWRNQFDSDAIPLLPDGDPDPVFPTSDPDIIWGFDKQYLLCPKDVVLALFSQEFLASFTVPYDSVFAFDTPVTTAFDFEDANPTPIPAGPGGFAMTAIGASAAPFTGTLSKLRFYALGGPGGSPTDYELVVRVNGVSQSVHAFTAGINTEVVFTLSVPVASTDVVGVSVRPATGGARTPAWTRIYALVFEQDSAVWTFDDTMPAGTYATERTL